MVFCQSDCNQSTTSLFDFWQTGQLATGLITIDCNWQLQSSCQSLYQLPTGLRNTMHKRTDAGSAVQSCAKLLWHVLRWKAHSFPMRSWGVTWRHAHPEMSILSVGLFVPCTVHIIPIEYHPCIALCSCFSTLV